MLALPSGQILAVVPGGTNGYLYVYTPTGSAQTAWKPTIAGVAADANGDGNYTLSGTQLNGLSAGASQGPNDSQMASNYPIVELTSASGQVYFARTFNWSSAAVATGNRPETTQFSLPAGMPGGTYKLSVVANGIASSPLSMYFSAIPTADLAVTDVGPSSVTVGDNGDTPTEVSYTITITNNGPGAATDVLLSDFLPAGSTLVSMTEASGSDVFTISNPQTNVVNAEINSMPAGSSDSFTLTVSAPVNLYNGDVFSNSATVTTNAGDPVSSNNTATATGSIVNTSVQSSALVVNDVGLASAGSAGLINVYGPTGSFTEAGQGTYRFTVTNNGPTDCPNAVLTDILGPGMELVSVEPGVGGVSYTQSGSDVIFDFGTVPAGQLVNAKVVVEYTGYGTLTNTASASSATDPDTTTNTLIVNVAVPEAPIVVSAPISEKMTSKSLSVSNKVVATFTHASGVEPASNFVATINWGDNSTSTGTVTLSGTTYSVTGSHTYSKSGTYTVSTTVTDPGGDPPIGATQNAMAIVATGNVATPAASTPSSGITLNSASANSATSASTAVSGGTPSVSSTTSSLVKAAGAGGQLGADLDILDALFELQRWDAAAADFL